MRVTDATTGARSGLASLEGSLPENHQWSGADLGRRAGDALRSLLQSRRA
jgi:hypothetical protein